MKSIRSFITAVLMASLSVISLATAEETLQEKNVETKASTNLIDCPDCTKSVSKRAVMCPHCGCPGEAIEAMVKKAEEAAKPKSIVSVHSDNPLGYGVAIREGESTSIILDSFLLADSNKLELQDLVKNQVLPYSTVLLSNDTSLMRLAVSSDDVNFSPIAPEISKPMSYLGHDGLPAKQDNAVAGLNEASETSTFLLNGQQIPIHAAMKWTAVSPKPLREQLNLLSRLKTERESGKKPTLTSSEAATKWLTPAFSKLASELTKEPHPSP